jgi:hypothetical protein
MSNLATCDGQDGGLTTAVVAQKWKGVVSFVSFLLVNMAQGSKLGSCNEEECKSSMVGEA